MAKAEPTEAEIVASVDFGGLVKESDPLAIAQMLYKRVLDAETMDAAFDVLEGKTSDDYVGRTFIFSDMEFAWYESERGPVPSASGKAQDGSTGEIIDFWTSAGMLTVLLAKAKMTNSFPVTWKITEKKTNSGQKALNFERVS